MLDIYQDTVEELMDEQSQCGGQDVSQVVQELHIHHHGFVSHNKCPVVPNKTHYKNHLIDQLQVNKKKKQVIRLREKEITGYWICSLLKGKLVKVQITG